MISVWHNWSISMVSRCYSWFPLISGLEPDLLCYYLRTLSRSSGPVNLQLQCNRCFGDGVGAQGREWLSRGRPLGRLKKAHNAGSGLPKRRGGWGGGTQLRKKVPLKFNYIYWRSIVHKTVAGYIDLIHFSPLPSEAGVTFSFHMCGY